MFLQKLFSQRTSKTSEVTRKRAAIYRNFLRREAKTGGTLFGAVPYGGKREFFCLDATTWVWHEEWIDERGQRQVRTTRYDVRPTGILKAQNGQGYHLVSPEEAKNLVAAIDAYTSKVQKEVYPSYA